jgi:CheY-like chemotaxis protein
MAHVLLVEDDKATRNLLKATLAKAGHTVAVANDGAAGFEEATKQRPDLIVMDLGLPQVSGYQAIRHLKRHPLTQAIPVLVLSGATTAADKDEAYEAGCDAYETKPVQIQRFMERVEEVVRKA